MAGTSVKNPPYNAPMLDRAGLMAVEWRAFLRDLYARVGGTQALSNHELAALPALELAALTTRVTSTESAIAALQLLTTSQGNSITDLQQQVSNLGVGPTL